MFASTYPIDLFMEIYIYVRILGEVVKVFHCQLRYFPVQHHTETQIVNSCFYSTSLRVGSIGPDFTFLCIPPTNKEKCAWKKWYLEQMQDKNDWIEVQYKYNFQKQAVLFTDLLKFQV